MIESLTAPDTEDPVASKRDEGPVSCASQSAKTKHVIRHQDSRRPGGELREAAFPRRRTARRAWGELTEARAHPCPWRGAVGGLGGGEGAAGPSRAREALQGCGSRHAEPPVLSLSAAVGRSCVAASMPSQPPALTREEWRVLGGVLSPAVWAARWPPLPGGGGGWAVGPEAQPWWDVGV